jgi:hypothetical protein
MSAAAFDLNVLHDQLNASPTSKCGEGSPP